MFQSFECTLSKIFCYEDEFDLVFWSIGEVHSCRMVSHPDGQPKGFGFVEYQKKSDAHAAIQLLNGRTFRGRQLIVKLTRSPGPKCRGRAPFTESKKRRSANNPSGMEFQESKEEKAFLKQEVKQNNKWRNNHTDISSWDGFAYYASGGTVWRFFALFTIFTPPEVSKRLW